MRTGRSFLLSILLPVLLTAGIAMLVNMVALHSLKELHGEGFAAQRGDLAILKEATKLSDEMATMQDRVSDLLRRSDAGELDEGAAYRLHVEVVDGLAGLAQRVQALARHTEVLAGRNGDAEGLRRDFDDYRNYVVMATDIAAIDPRTASRHIDRARDHFIEFSEHAHRIASLLAERVEQTGLEGATAFDETFRRIVGVVIASALLIALLSYVAARAMSRRVTRLADALRLLAASQATPPALPAIESMADPRSGEHRDFGELARAVLAFRQALIDRRFAEIELREKEQHFRTLANGGSALIWTSGTDKMCNYFNEPWLRYTGRTLAEELGTGWTTGIHPDDLARCLDIYTAHFDRREPFDMEYRLRRADGSYGWILDQGTPRVDSRGEFIGYIGFCYDITERRLADDALKEREAQLRTLSDNLPGGLVFQLDTGIDGERRRFTYMSSGVMTIHGISIFEALGDPQEIYEQVVEEDRAKLATIEADAIGRLQPLHAEVRIRRRDGQQRWTLIRSAPRRQPDGHVIWDGIELDITSLKHAEQELALHRDRLELLVRERTQELTDKNRVLEQALAQLKLAQEELIQASKLSSLGELVAGVAHELNTPIGNARTVATTLCDQSGEFGRRVDSPSGIRKSEFQEFMHQVVYGTQLLESNLLRAANLIQSFKQVAVDRASSQRRPFGLRAVTEEVVATLRPRLKRDPVGIAIDIAPEIELDSYPGPYGQVLVNLIENALLHGLHDRAQGTIRIGAERRDDGVEIVVADDGWGIAAEHLPRIFDPFFTTRLGQGGSGLGLPIVYNIVTGLLGGKITVDSSPGQGARFRIAIPLTAPAQPGETSGALP